MSAHPADLPFLTHTRVVFSPSNYITRLQPVDLGIIRWVYAQYTKIPCEDCLYRPSIKKEFEKNWILYDMHKHMLIYSWNNITTRNLFNCFRNTRFFHSNNAKIIPSQKNENISNDFNFFGPGDQKCIPYLSNALNYK